MNWSASYETRDVRWRVLEVGEGRPGPNAPAGNGQAGSGCHNRTREANGVTYIKYPFRAQGKLEKGRKKISREANEAYPEHLLLFV